MTDTTEMPVEIWVDECYWYPAELVAKGQGEYRDNKLATYIRTDTIPSKAEVAREFFERVKCVESEYHCNRTGMIVSGGGRDAIESRIIRTMGQVLKEWEDAESK